MVLGDSRAVPRGFMRCGLRVGGVAWVSHNAAPGWAAFEAVRHLREVAASGFTLARVIDLERLPHAAGVRFAFGFLA